MDQRKKKMIYHADAPYPPVTVEQPNLDHARILMDDYAGAASELTTILTYIYQYFELGESYKEVATTLHGIAIVEMHHLEMLGDLIRQLGGDPVYGTFNRKKFNFWNGRYISYTKTIGNLLMEDIQGEEGAVEGYKHSIERICDEKVNDVLRRIILDETLHIQLLKALLERYS